MDYDLAQLNIANMIVPIDDPVIKDFVDNLERINLLAEDLEGFTGSLKIDFSNKDFLAHNKTNS